MLKCDEIEILDEIEPPRIMAVEEVIELPKLKEEVQEVEAITEANEMQQKSILVYSFLMCVLVLIVTQIVVFSIVAFNNI